MRILGGRCVEEAKKSDGENGIELYRLCLVVEASCQGDRRRKAATRLARERTRVQDRPNSIARVNARFAGGNASSNARPMPRGQRKIAASSAKIRASPCVKAMPA